MAEQKVLGIANLDHLVYNRDYMETFLKYLDKEDPIAMMFKYALRIMPCRGDIPEPTFDHKKKFIETIDTLNVAIDILKNDPSRLELKQNEVTNELINAIRYTEIVFAAWKRKYDFEYLVK